jgi:hypothetical protein
MDSNMHDSHRNTYIWIGIAAGAAVGIIIAATRHRPRDRWSSAKQLTRKLSDHSVDFADRGKDIINRCQNIYEEGRKVVDDAVDLWSHGRKLVGV